MSSGVNPSYSAMISAVVAPWASRFRIYSTVSLVPLITGLPTITRGSKAMRSSNWSSFTAVAPSFSGVCPKSIRLSYLFPSPVYHQSRPPAPVFTLCWTYRPPPFANSIRDIQPFASCGVSIRYNVSSSVDECLTKPVVPAPHVLDSEPPLSTQ